MRYLEQYLCNIGDETIVSMIKEGGEEAKLFWPDSGDTFKWVSILRGADLHWTTREATCANISLFRLREEGLIGDSPQIIVRCADRYNWPEVDGCPQHTYRFVKCDDAKVYFLAIFYFLLVGTVRSRSFR
jgi:hypothetical protein